MHKAPGNRPERPSDVRGLVIPQAVFALQATFSPQNRTRTGFPTWAEKVPVNMNTGQIRPLYGYCRDAFGAPLWSRVPLLIIDIAAPSVAHYGRVEVLRLPVGRPARRRDRMGLT